MVVRRVCSRPTPRRGPAQSEWGGGGWGGGGGREWSALMANDKQASSPLPFFLCVLWSPLRPPCDEVGVRVRRSGVAPVAWRTKRPHPAPRFPFSASWLRCHPRRHHPLGPCRHGVPASLAPRPEAARRRSALARAGGRRGKRGTAAAIAACSGVGGGARARGGVPVRGRRADGDAAPTVVGRHACGRHRRQRGNGSGCALSTLSVVTLSF